MSYIPSKKDLEKYALQAKEKALGLKDHKIAYIIFKAGAVGTTIVITTAGSVVLAERMIPKNPSMNLELELVPDSTQNTTTSVIEQAVTEALTQNTTEEPTYTTTIKPTENITEPVVTTIPVYTETDIVATETTTYYVDPTTNTVKTTTTTRQPSTQATTTKKQTTVTTPKQTTKVTTTTTQKVTQPVTQAPTQSSTEPNYDYKLEDIATNANAFNVYAQRFNKDLLKGNGIYLPSTGITGGGREARFTLAMLNEDKISDEVLKEMFKDYDMDEIYSYKEYVYNIAKSQTKYGTDVDFTKYTLDKKLGNYLNSIDEANRKGEIDQFLYGALMEANMPEYLYKPIVVAMWCSYDKNEKYISTKSADYDIEGFVDKLCNIVHGKTYTK